MKLKKILLKLRKNFYGYLRKVKDFTEVIRVFKRNS